MPERPASEGGSSGDGANESGPGSRVLLVDWGLAERLAIGLGGSGPEWDGTEEELRSESGRAAHLVRRYTGLRPKGRLPAAELVDRGEWARVNLESFQDLSANVEERLEGRMKGSGDGRASGLQRTIVRVATGAEVGLTVGYLSQRVIGQYDVALIGPARAPRLLFVGPNLSAARARLEVDRDLFLRWIALHETTHAVHFAAVPWLREHIGGIAEELFAKAAVEVKPSEILGKLARLNPRELLRSVKSGELATLLLPQDQRRLIDRLMAIMTLVEGYAEHVMDAVGHRLDPRYMDLRRALDRDRARRGLLDSIVSKVLGLEMKLAQYRRGKVFADEVVRAHGIRTLNRAWSGPDALPRPEELDSPAEWVERVGAVRERSLFALFRQRPLRPRADDQVV
jgi:coenzyme F420 biosynthesis associated uncharacterized protein